MVTYLGPYLNNLAKESETLRKLLGKDVVWTWDSNHDCVFNRLKQIITTAPVLRHFDVKLPITLSVDASSTAVGAVLLQKGQPVSYASKSLTESQQRYAQIEKELYAIQFGCQKFHQFFYGHMVNVETDHRPLVTLFQKPLADVPSRLQRMMLALQSYHLKVIYVPGKHMFIADALSRAPLPETEVTDIEQDVEVHINLLLNNLAMSEQKREEFIAVTNDDPTLSVLKKYYYEGWPCSKIKVEQCAKPYWNMRSEIHVAGNLVFRGSSLVVPAALRHEILRKVHMGHQGLIKTKNLVRGIIYWPNMNSDLENLINQCEICAKFRCHNPHEPIVT